MQGFRAMALAGLAAGALVVGGCNRENPPSTNAQGAPDSAPPPVPTPTRDTGAPAATGSPSGTGTSGATGTGPTAGGANAAEGTPPQGGPNAGSAPGGGTATSPSGTGALPANTPAGGTTPPAQSAAGSALTLSDQNFLTGAAASGQMEIAAARAAAQQASNGNVKSFAGLLLKDHTATHADLNALAAAKGLRLPTEVDAGRQPALDALLNARGAEFDRLFVQTIGIAAHRSDIALFEQAARDGQDADVRAFAAKVLPKLREHLTAAGKLPGASGIGANTPAGSERKAP